MNDKLTVALASRSYDILMGERLLLDAGQLIAQTTRASRAVVITDDHVARLYLHRLMNSLDEAQIRARPIILRPGEASKSLSQFSELMETLLEQQPDRKTLLIALGGGVIGDITGFAASVLLRGVDFVQIPTTLLAQVDSSVGGKTGINSGYGKNLIGSFYQPKLVLTDISTLSTLPERELRAGYAEVVKYGMIADADFFNWCNENIATLLGGDSDARKHAISRSCAIKAAIVAEDEREQGKRALLNFGHTFGHALEAETGYNDTLLHGEAVAIGMVFATQLSAALGHCNPEIVEQLINHLKRAGLPVAPKQIHPQWDVERLMARMFQDKKAENQTLTFVLCRAIGDSFVAKNIPAEIVKTLSTNRLTGNLQRYG